MDVYHKVLAKVYETTGGRDNADVDFVDLLKREGFYPSIDEIKAYMSGESWITETSNVNTIRITHWGVAEAKKTLAATPDSANIVTKQSNRLLFETRDFIVILEEFMGRPSADNFKGVEKKFGELSAIFKTIKENV